MLGASRLGQTRTAGTKHVHGREVLAGTCTGISPLGDKLLAVLSNGRRQVWERSVHPRGTLSFRLAQTLPSGTVRFPLWEIGWIFKLNKIKNQKKERKGALAAYRRAPPTQLQPHSRAISAKLTCPRAAVGLTAPWFMPTHPSWNRKMQLSGHDAADLF